MESAKGGAQAARPKSEKPIHELLGAKDASNIRRCVLAVGHMIEMQLQIHGPDAEPPVPLKKFRDELLELLPRIDRIIKERRPGPRRKDDETPARKGSAGNSRIEELGARLSKKPTKTHRWKIYSAKSPKHPLWYFEKKSEAEEWKKLTGDFEHLQIAEVE